MSLQFLRLDSGVTRHGAPHFSGRPVSADERWAVLLRTFLYMHGSLPRRGAWAWNCHVIEHVKVPLGTVQLFSKVVE